MPSSDQILEVPTGNSKEAKIQRYAQTVRLNEEYRERFDVESLDPKAVEKAAKVLKRLESEE